MEAIKVLFLTVPAFILGIKSHPILYCSFFKGRQKNLSMPPIFFLQERRLDLMTTVIALKTSERLSKGLDLDPKQKRWQNQCPGKPIKKGTGRDAYSIECN